MVDDARIVEAAYQDVVAEWADRDIVDRDRLAVALADYRVRFAYHSGTIENPSITYRDTRDVFEDGRVAGFSGDPRTLFEIQNLKECHEVILDAFANRRPIDEQFVLDVHRTLTQGTYDNRRWAAGERPWYRRSLEPPRARRSPSRRTFMRSLRTSTPFPTGTVVVAGSS